MKKIFLALATAATLLASCEKDESKAGIFKGPEVQVYDGKAWAWVQLDKNEVPERVGVSITDKALNSVPMTMDPAEGPHAMGSNFVLPFHRKADTTPFKHVWLNWNAMGHPPAGVYTVPHFDIHYYMVPTEERETYVDQAKLDASPEADYIPANHLGVDPLPQMGKHFVDLASPELNGQLFTQTFIFGSYDKKSVFWEPMITLDFLKKTTNFERTIPQPAKVQKSGYYPTKMRVTKENGVTNIILEAFVKRQAS
ncbi:MAG TPA: hypothetical protein VEB42_04670 [Chitinophagaceae bacterium]|nr:hypothetical protein [Chitinophagaceae bacterium]